MREYKAIVGETDGNIIAAIITTHTPRNQLNAPRFVHGPSSIPSIRPTVHHQPIPARPSSKPMSASRVLAAAKATAPPPRPRPPARDSSAEALNRSGSPGELGRRQARLALVL